MRLWRTRLGHGLRLRVDLVQDDAVNVFVFGCVKSQFGIRLVIRGSSCESVDVNRATACRAQLDPTLELIEQGLKK